MTGGGQTHTQVPRQRWQQPSDHEALVPMAKAPSVNQIRQASDPAIATVHSAR